MGKESWGLRKLKKRIEELEADLHYSRNMLEKVSDILIEVGSRDKKYSKLYADMYHLWLYRVRRQEKRLKKLYSKLERKIKCST